MKIENMMDFNMVLPTLPKEIAVDVQSRMIDHFVSGGEPDDPYIKQQLKYVEKVMNDLREVRFTQKTLDIILEEIIDEYFSEDTQKYGLGLWEVMEYVKGKYYQEISRLPNR